MADTETKLLTHYKLNTLFPSEWPADRDEDSDSSDTEIPKQPVPRPVQRVKSRYSVLESGPSSRISVPGVEKSKDGIENLVQRDEPDPLGSTSSVVQVLRSRGLPVEEDMKLRNRFLLSSTTFSPSLFLSQVHSSASTESLLQGLDFLSRSIEKKSASLKVLVESNFERFVRAKATIDNVYTEMRNQGAEEELPLRSPHSRTHSRQISTGGRPGHFRKFSTSSRPLTPNLGAETRPSDKKKNALTKESEYGVAGIKAPLVEVTIKAEEVWGPALGGREREETMKAVLTTIERHRGLFELGASLQDAIKRKDNEMIVEEYAKARRYVEDAQDIANRATRQGAQLTDADVYQILVTARIWTDFEKQIEALKSDLWSRLAGTHFAKHTPGEDEKKEEHMELIKVLLELGVEDNPFEIWLISRYHYLKNRITATAERSKVEIEILRRRLASGEKPSMKQISAFLRAPSERRTLDAPSALDTTKIVEFWDYVLVSMSALLSPKGGLLAEIIEFWETAQSIVSGGSSSNLPSGPDGISQQHHRLTEDAVRHVQSGAAELEALLREAVTSFFVEPPVEDISLLFSPIPPTPDTPRTPRTPKSALLSPFVDSRFKWDPKDLPPPSPKVGAAWESFAFWPPNANSLSGVHYLSKIILLIGTAAAELANQKIPQEAGGRPSDEPRRLVNRVRERCASAICAAWDRDAEYGALTFEDWTRHAEKREVTNFPSRFMALETTVVNGLQDILYLEEVSSKASDVVKPPSQSLVQMVTTHFVGTLRKMIAGLDDLVKEGDRNTNEEDITVPARKNQDNGLGNTIDASSKSVRILLALSNISNLRSTVLPTTLQTYETAFSITLPDETKRLNAELSDLDARLFKAYITPHNTYLKDLIQRGITSPTWEPPTPRPSDARPYVYSVLLRLVLIHTELTTYTPPLTSPMLRQLLERISLFMITAFESRPRYSLPALMQATLDTEFLAQTLGQYTTDKASEIQSKIYVVLDERTGQAERVRLQEELQEMRSVLKRLREGTRGEFGCFKRGRGGRPISRGRD